jgi:hypothetical protein
MTIPIVIGLLLVLAVVGGGVGLWLVKGRSQGEQPAPPSETSL